MYNIWTPNMLSWASRRRGEYRRNTSDIKMPRINTSVMLLLVVDIRDSVNVRVHAYLDGESTDVKNTPSR